MFSLLNALVDHDLEFKKAILEHQFKIKKKN